MKRSEMVQKLSNFIDAHFGSEIQGTHGYLAREILTFLEQQEMSPPFCYEIFSKVWRDGGSGYAWEKE